MKIKNVILAGVAIVSGYHIGKFVGYFRSSKIIYEVFRDGCTNTEKQVVANAVGKTVGDRIYEHVKTEES